MLRNYYYALLPAFITVMLLTGCAPQQPVTLESLLKEMADRENLARYPDPWYTTRQFSSYDRDAVEPGDPSWFANWDRSMFIREEENDGRKEYVMYETDGPGAVVRFWMTFAGPGAGEGILRFYFDHETEPTIRGDALEIISGGKLVGAPLSSSVSPLTDYKMRGHNLYLPLPYASHLKITYESENIKDAGATTGGEAVYYNINYRTYEGGTQVTTFSHDQLNQVDSLLQQVQQKLRERNKEEMLEQLETTDISFAETIEPGETFRQTIRGPAAIRRLNVKLDASNREQALRSTVMELIFDNHRTAWVPVGDFFGTGYQIRSSDTWYTTVTNDQQMYAYWVMPFKESAEVIFHNLGEQPVKLSNSSISWSEWEWGPASMHFGATWQNYSDLYTGEPKDNEGGGNPFDVNYTHVEGEGIYAGEVLTLFNTAWVWWGEGDEKIYIDGEDFPSHFGTGSEDYFGYAWVRPEVFTNHPFISQPDGSGNITPGYTVNMRYRSLDAIPFRKELKVDMEMWHWVSTIIDYAPVSYFYLKPGGEIQVQPDPGGAREKIALKRSDIISPRIQDNRMEGENLVLDTLTGGSIRYQYLEEPKLSGNKQLWWRGGTIGDELRLHFISDENTTYTLTGKFVRAPDYGSVRITIKGKTALDRFNGYRESLSATEVALGTHKISKGKNEMVIRILGTSPTEDKAFWGLDYIDFEKVR